LAHECKCFQPLPTVVSVLRADLKIRFIVVSSPDRSVKVLCGVTWTGKPNDTTQNHLAFGLVVNGSDKPPNFKPHQHPRERDCWEILSSDWYPRDPRRNWSSFDGARPRQSSAPPCVRWPGGSISHLHQNRSYCLRSRRELTLNWCQLRLYNRRYGPQPIGGGVGRGGRV
jgi:hypothetical protein